MSSQTESSNPEDAIRVLHVDDEHSPLEFTKSFVELSDRAIHMESVATPEAALRRLEEVSFDCVVSDYQMPDLNGIELARRVRGFSEVPIIIYTGRGSEEVASRAFAAGIDDYMRKEIEPSHYEVLARRIRAAVEKRRATEALIESERKYRSLVQNTIDGILVFTGRKLVFANQQAAALHGCSNVEELMKTEPSRLLHPDDREYVEERSLARQRGEDIPPMTEFRLVLPDGTVRHLQSSSSLILYGGKNSTLAFLRDITESKRMEEEIRSLARFPSENSNPVLRISKNGVILYANDAARPLLEEQESKNGDVAPDEWAEWASEAHDSGLREVRDSIHGDRLFSFSVVPVVDTDYVNMYGRDITEHRRMDDELGEQNRLNRIILDGFPCVALLLKSSTREIVASNAEAVKIGAVPGEHCYSTWLQREDPCPGCLAPEVWAGKGAQHLVMDALDTVWDTYWLPVSDDLYMHYAFDITERKRAEEGLREKDYIIRSASSVIATSSLDGTMTYVNPAFLKTWGFDNPDEVIGRPFPEFWMVSDKLDEIMAALMGEEKKWSGEVQAKKKDGSFFDVHVSAATVLDDKGNPVALTSTSADITERKRIETELHDSEERWRSLVELAPDGIITVDLKGFVTSINDAFVKLTGFSREEIVGKHFTRIGSLRARDIPIYVKLFSSLLKGDIPPSYEFIFKRKDGSEGWAEMQLRLIGINKKKELLAVVSDVSERKRMEEELKQHSEHLEELVQEKTMELSVSEERLRSFTASAPDAFTLYDSELNCLDVNQAVLKYWPEGTRKEDLIGRNMLDLSPYVKESGRYERYLEVIKTGKPFQIEDPTTHPFLGDARLSLRAFKVGEGLGIITTDITEQKRMEEQLVEAERISAMGRVSAMMGHDLRGPLQSIMNALYIMEKTPEKAGELREKIEESVNYATRILDDLRYSTGDVPIHLQKSNVGTLLQKTVENSQVPQNIEVDLDVGEGLTTVHIDPLMTQRISTT